MKVSKEISELLSFIFTQEREAEAVMGYFNSQSTNYKYWEHVVCEYANAGKVIDRFLREKQLFKDKLSDLGLEVED